jgi:hypothetical protein
VDGTKESRNNSVSSPPVIAILINAQIHINDDKIIENSEKYIIKIAINFK